MRKYVFIILALVFTIYITGCGKKESSLQKAQEPMSIEALSALSSKNVTVSESKNQTIQVPSVTETKLEPLPPGPSKPTVYEIQTALKKAGFYTGAIDGKIGPLTSKAIEEFQKANGLKADGKVGPKTWAVLNKYLKPAPVEPTKEKSTLKNR